MCSSGTSPMLNASPESLTSDAPPGTTSLIKRNEYRSPHTPPMPKKVAEELSRGHGLTSGGRQSSLSSSTSAKLSKKRHAVTPERSSAYHKRTRSRDRDTSPYEYDSRRFRERERASSPYGSSRKYRDRKRRSR